VIISKDGKPLPSGQVLAEPGEKGIQREVRGEGWHFVMPVLYTCEIETNTDIPPGKVGIVTAKGGKPLPPGRLLAEPGEQGIQRQVLPPGMYRINLHGFEVQQVDATRIELGFVGVVRRQLGRDGASRFARSGDEKGILPTVLQPGMYYINIKEFEVQPVKVGIFQSTFHYDHNPARSTAITFVSKGGFAISMDCTIEWEILPEDMPTLVAEYGTREAIENTVIDVQAHAIGRDKGIDYGVQDFLEGPKREAFQDDFTRELVKVCREKNVTVHSAFIRNIVIPEQYLQPIRDKQIAAETEITNKAKEATAESEAEVEREKEMINQKAAEVEAETKRLVAAIDREVENVAVGTEATIDKLKAEYQARIASLDAQKTQTLGEADAEVTRLTETARSSLYQLKMDVFRQNAESFLRYTLSQKLSDKLVLRLFHSGAGTFWTNMDGKGVNLLLPAPGATPRDNAPAR
jgi:regulator of protease activity HflC (stomatin/prohibitin superfamily)